MAPKSKKKKGPDCYRTDRAVTGSLKSGSIITVLSLITETARCFLFFIFSVAMNSSNAVLLLFTVVSQIRRISEKDEELISITMTINIIKV